MPPTIRAMSTAPVTTPVADATADAHQGLGSAEAARRLAIDGPNALPGSAPRSAAALLWDVLTEPMLLMLLAAGGIYLALGDRGEALFLLSFVFVVIGITLAQTATQRALDPARPVGTARPGHARWPGATHCRQDVVRGDLLILHEGDRIAADAQLIQGQLEVDESLLTGEAVPVTELPAAQADQATAAAAAASTAPPNPSQPPQGQRSTPWPAWGPYLPAPWSRVAWGLAQGVRHRQPYRSGPPGCRSGDHCRARLGAATRFRARWCVGWAPSRWCWPVRRWCWAGGGTAGRCSTACCLALRWPWPSCPKKSR